MNKLFEYMHEESIQLGKCVPVQLSVYEDGVNDPLDDFLWDHTVGEVNEIFGRDMFNGDAADEEGASEGDYKDSFSYTVANNLDGPTIFLVELMMAHREYYEDGGYGVISGVWRPKWFLFDQNLDEPTAAVQEWVDKNAKEFREESLKAEA